MVVGLGLLALVMAAGVAHWRANRPERDAAWEEGDQRVEFGPREGFVFRLPYEYLPEFLDELRGEFAERWTPGQVSNLVANVIDERRNEWRGRYVVRRAGLTDEMAWQFFRVNRDRVLCAMEGPHPFVAVVRKVAHHYPAQAV